MKLLSVIIVTYNSENEIFECLSSIYKYNDIGDALEVIVVDNNSKNYLRMRDSLLNLYADRIQVLSNATNGGYGQGNNIGVKTSTAPYFLIMNPDVRLVMPIFGSTLRNLNRNDVVMCGFKSMENLNEPNYSFYYTHTTNAFVYVFAQKRLLSDNYVQKKMFLSGACFAMRKDTFEQIGLFDENIFLYGEENDIHYRLHKFFPRARIFYDSTLKYVHPINNRETSDKTLKQMWLSRLYFYQKNNLSTRYFYWNEWLKIQLSKIIVLLLHRNMYYSKYHKIYARRIELLKDVYCEKYSTKK